MPRIHIICPYPTGEAPSQRFRFEQYLDLLKKNGFEIKIHPFFNQKQWNNLYKKGKAFQKIWAVFTGFFKRFFLLFKIRKTDILFIHREITPIGPPIYEWILLKILKRNAIYDFDDAIWLPNTSSANKAIGKLKWHSKVKHIIKWSSVISCGNEYLAAYAKKFNSNVIIIPTTIDLNYHKKLENQKENKKTIIGWTGSHSTINYLQELINPLTQLAKEFDFELNIISNFPPEFDLPNLKFQTWTAENEINQLNKFDIGIMPLPHEEWAKGKCAFKALQYMSLGIPVVISNFGMNKELIQDNVNGFLAKNENDWYQKLKILLENKSRRLEIGNAGEITIENKFSVEANSERFLEIFLHQIML